MTILDTLCTDRYLAWSDPGWQGVLKHGVYHFHKKLGVAESVMWGEFFFLEAVDKVLRDRDRIVAGRRSCLTASRPSTCSPGHSIAGRFSAQTTVRRRMTCYTMNPARLCETELALLDQAARTSIMRSDHSSDHDDPDDESDQSQAARGP